MQTLAQMVAAETVGRPTSVLDLIVEHGRVVKDPSQTEKVVEMISEFIEQVPGRVTRKSANATEMIAERIAKIDRLISDQVNEIMHAPEFQALESTWRGLEKLVETAAGAGDLMVKVLPANKKELLKDFERASDFDQSSIFKLIYEEEFGTLGGVPFGVLLTDFQFGRSAQDLRLLESLSHVAAAAHAPIITSPAPSLFDMDSFLDLGAPRELSKIFESGELAAWRAFRDSEDSRYVVMALPRVLMRQPYGPDTVPVDEFAFVEACDGAGHEHYLWGSAAWALGQRIAEAYGEYGWCAAIRGVEGGGKVSDLPLHFYSAVSGDTVVKCPTEVTITDRREKELSDLGFMPLCFAKGSDYAAFFGAQTVHRPAVYSTNLANDNARLASMLPYILAASRFAHYLKSIMRDKVGSFQSRSAVEKYLNEWIVRYVTSDDEATQEVKARFPLREALVQVQDVPGKPGAYKSVVFLRPHFQLEELTASIRLVAELPSSKG
ncbi:type VI secretion system contractile sheath large subunit [Variovorax saccharolyticus]|uniref:type VI secretion system contractile sheath large subunit n=1 Tax=Variovorax saccharolyticus TaxID=3053516 RepID=UPI002577D1BE|nr:type VI secretion system contractile sheath large subunit [Variovorax sp. J31P216]MDM0029799.1 type VI secretion system contractile sheath large subunit [Variovorax sp. J31P216]